MHQESVRRRDLTGPTFTLGSRVDADSGGWRLAELERNLGLCIAEKTAKVAAYRARYPEWWLLLVDQIGYGLVSEETPRGLPGIGPPRPPRLAAGSRGRPAGSDHQGRLIRTYPGTENRAVTGLICERSPAME